jgi:N-dimethylarginine dimethylaminohydrolase
MPRDIPFEGAGDALFDRGADRLWMAHGHRSVIAAREQITALFQVEVATLQLIDQRFYHLDTCFCPLIGGYLVYYPPAFDPPSQKQIEKLVPAEKRIAIGEEDALNFACNAVNAGKYVVVNRATRKFADALGRHGFEVVQTSMSEFMKAGGSAKCLTLRLDEE